MYLFKRLWALYSAMSEYATGDLIVIQSLNGFRYIEKTSQNQKQDSVETTDFL